MQANCRGAGRREEREGPRGMKEKRWRNEIKVEGVRGEGDQGIGEEMEIEMQGSGEEGVYV